MLASIKELIKKLPFPLFHALYYPRYLLREHRQYEANRRRAGLRRLDEVDLSTWKASDVLVILGSGPSINDITAERWKSIAACDTVGFNFWLYHPFVPKFYFAESASASDYQEVNRRYREVAERRSEAYKEALKVIMGLHWRDDEVLQWPAEWRRQFVSAYDLPAPARTGAEFRRVVRALRSLGAFRPSPRIRWLFKYGASVTTLLVFGLRMGYRTIVLCGMDMKAQDYFYTDPELYPENAAYQPVPYSSVHGFTAGLPWRQPIDEVVCELNRELLEPAGVALYLENRRSILWPRIAEVPSEIFGATVSAPGDQARIGSTQVARKSY